MKAFLEQCAEVGNRRDGRSDALARFAVTVGADRRLPPAPHRLYNRRADRAALRLRVKHRAGALAPLLAVADVDAGRIERRRLIDSARGITDHRVDLIHQADVAKLPE